MSDIITKDGAFILNVYFKITLICSEFFSPLVLSYYVMVNIVDKHVT